MRRKLLILVVCIFSASLFSGCAAPVAEQVALQSTSSASEWELFETLGESDLYVIFGVEGAEVTLESVDRYAPKGKLDAIYDRNQEAFDRLSDEELKSTLLKECVKISGGSNYDTCYGNYPSMGSLFRETSLDGGGLVGNVFATAIGSPFLVLGMVFDTADTVDELAKMSDSSTENEVNREQVNRIGSHVSNMLLAELRSSTASSDSIWKLLQKYPAAGFENNKYLVDKMAGFADKDYAQLNKASSSDVEAFIAKYSGLGGKSCLTPTTSTLNVRKGPGTKHKVAFAIGTGDRICKELDSSDGWVKFAGSEISSRYSGDYWVSKKFLKSVKVASGSSSGNKLSQVLDKARSDQRKINERVRQQRIAAENLRKKQQAAEAEARRIAAAKKEAELKKQKLAKIKPQLDAAIAEGSMSKLETFINTYKYDDDAAELMVLANAKYKELLFAD